MKENEKASNLFFFLFLFEENSLNTPLHLCAIHDKVECMKLLLRSGADPLKKNATNRTSLDIAIDKRHESCEELVSSKKVVVINFLIIIIIFQICMIYFS